MAKDKQEQKISASAWGKMIEELSERLRSTSQIELDKIDKRRHEIEAEREREKESEIIKNHFEKMAGTIQKKEQSKEDVKSFAQNKINQLENLLSHNQKEIIQTRELAKNRLKSLAQEKTKVRKLEKEIKDLKAILDKQQGREFIGSIEF